MKPWNFRTWVKLLNCKTIYSSSIVIFWIVNFLEYVLASPRHAPISIIQGSDVLTRTVRMVANSAHTIYFSYWWHTRRSISDQLYLCWILFYLCWVLLAVKQLKNLSAKKYYRTINPGDTLNKRSIVFCFSMLLYKTFFDSSLFF